VCSSGSISDVYDKVCAGATAQLLSPCTFNLILAAPGRVETLIFLDRLRAIEADTKAATASAMSARQQLQASLDELALGNPEFVSIEITLAAAREQLSWVAAESLDARLLGEQLEKLYPVFAEKEALRRFYMTIIQQRAAASSYATGARRTSCTSSARSQAGTTG